MSDVQRRADRRRILIEIEAAVFRGANIVVRPLLQSRLHGILSQRLMLLQYTGGKTGKTYTFPIGYFPWTDGHVLSISSQRAWPAAIVQREVRLLIRGEWQGARPTVTTDQHEKADLLGEFARSKGPRATRGLMLGLPGDRLPVQDELLDAAAKTTVVLFRLAESTGEPAH